MKKTTFTHLIERNGSNLDLDIISKKNFSKEDIEIIDEKIDDFMLVNNVHYEDLIKYDKFLKVLHSSIKNDISTKIHSYHVYDTFNEKNNNLFKVA